MAKIPYVKYRAPKAKQARSAAGQRFLLRRAILKWLASRKDAPCGMALDVPTGVPSGRADVAAFWTRPGKEGAFRVLQPARTCVVICALDRRECYDASVNPDALCKELARLQKSMTLLESQIRQEEPGLRDTHVLFEEYADWDYEHSSNPRYRAERARAKEISESLRHGTRMERIWHSEVADELYLAIPEGAVFPDEVIPEWGVLTVSPEGEVTVARKASSRKASPARQRHLMTQIAIAASKYLLACVGISGKEGR